MPTAAALCGDQSAERRNAPAKAALGSLFRQIFSIQRILPRTGYSGVVPRRCTGTDMPASCEPGGPAGSGESPPIFAPRRVECASLGRGGGAYSLERRQTPGDLHHDGVLSALGQRLSWRETARAFQTSWEAVYRSVQWFVEWFVEWGLAHRQRSGVEAIAVDGIQLGMRQAGRKLSNSPLPDRCALPTFPVVGRRRSQFTLRRGLKVLGPEVVQGLRFGHRHVEALLAGHCGRGRTGFARSAPLPHCGPPESGGGRGAPR
jgi:hypothetical protein